MLLTGKSGLWAASTSARGVIVGICVFIVTGPPSGLIA